MPVKLEQLTSNPKSLNLNVQVSDHHIGTNLGPMIKNSVAGPESNSNFEASQNDLDFYNMGAPMQIVGLEDLAQPFKLANPAV